MKTMMEKILIATNNQGKMREIREVLGEVAGVEVVGLEEARIRADEPEENGVTFEENGRIKARYYGDLSGMMTLADDSGIEVEVLGGFPGVRSARWMNGTQEEKNLELVRRAEERSGGERPRAAFVAVMVLYDPKTGEEEVFMGRVEGYLIGEERGEEGFGYDPIFVPEGHERTMAELGVKVKNEISHRRRALEGVANSLREFEVAL